MSARHASGERTLSAAAVAERQERSVPGYRRTTVRRLGHYVFVRHRQNWKLLFRFGLVGGSGVLVNTLVVILLKRTGPHFEDVFIDLPLTDFNVRWYHLYLTLSLLGIQLMTRRETLIEVKTSSWTSNSLRPSVSHEEILHKLRLLTIDFAIRDRKTFSYNLSDCWAMHWYRC